MGFNTVHWLLFAGINLLSAVTNAISIVVIQKRIKIDIGYKLLIWLDAINSFALATIVVFMTLLILTLEENQLLTLVACGSLWLAGMTPMMCGMSLNTATAAFR